jgi:hypothetical protein
MSKPFQQGQLDGLCGVYAMVNAVSILCGPLTTRQAQALFSKILQFLETRGSLASYCSQGIVLNDIAAILNQVICQQYPITRFKPFHHQPRVDKRQYLQALDAFLQQPDGVIFTGINGTYNHWTLIHRITDKTLHTYDSDQLHYLLLSSCSMSYETVLKRHWLLPTHTYLLKRKA